MPTTTIKLISAPSVTKKIRFITLRPQVGAGGVVHGESLLRAERFAAQSVEQIFQSNQGLEKQFQRQFLGLNNEIL